MEKFAKPVKIPTFVPNDSGSIIQDSFILIKIVLKMKSSIFIVAMLAIMSMTACTTSENDPMEQVETIDMLSSYGARSINSSDKNIKNLHLDELPGVSVSEVRNILSLIQRHTAERQTLDVKENLHGDHYDIDVTMDETINHKYTFTILLHMQKNKENGIVYYKSYETSCSANNFAWYIKGFSFATDNATGNNKFESPSYLYFKVMDEEVEYIQVPVSVKGTYCPQNNQAEFTYTL